MSSGKSPRPERTDTDESLQRERGKTDREIAKQAPAIEADADRVLERARKRAVATLDSARELADATLEATDASPTAVAAVERGRAREDAALETERTTAAETLDAERTERERALIELLRVERDETDDRLELERLRADDVIASRDNFLAMVSHDLRNLLGGVALSAGQIVRNASEESIVEHGQRIRRHTVRMNRLVGDLIDVVSMEAGKLSVAPRASDARSVVLELVETFRPNAAAKGVTLTTRVPDEPLTATFDPPRLEQVLANLVGNAIKFTPKGGAIEVVLAREGSELHFSVLDDGPGIDADSATRIFERFWQSSPGDRRGLGLGLYISRSIVEAHGGRIWFTARSSGGSAFHFTLPVTD